MLQCCERELTIGVASNRITIHFSIGYLAIYVLVVIAIAGILDYAYFRVDTNLRSVIAFGCSLLGAMIAISTLLYTAQNLKASNREKKAVAAAKFIERWNHPSYDSIRKACTELNTELDQLSPEARANVLLQDVTKRRTATELLNFFEEMAVIVNNEALDEDILQRFFRSLVIVYWDRYSYWVAKCRKDKRWPRVFCELEVMATKWKKEEAPPPPPF